LTERVRLESILCSEQAFGLKTASPLQRAICRASDGEPLGKLWEVEAVRTAFGNVRPPEVPPENMIILSAIRCAKSMIAAGKAIQISQNVDLDVDFISAGDELRIPIVSVDKDKARAVFSHMLGHIQAKPLLRRLLVKEPTADSFWLRHPSGRPIEVCTTPLANQGTTLVARWLPAVIFDEAPLMASVSDAKKNLDDALSAITGRVLPGGQVLMIGSPWAPFGPIYDLVQAHFGKPTEEYVVVRAPGWVMNPVYWTPKRCAQVKKAKPADYQRNVEAEFADVEDGIFSSSEIEKATRAGPVVRPYVKGHHYRASMDPAFRGNGWTLTLVECTGATANGVTPTYAVALAEQWVGSKVEPLKANTVLGEIAAILGEYGIDSVTSDQHNVDTIREIAETHGISIVEVTITSENRLEMVENVAALLSDERLELPPNRQLAGDLKAARKRVTQNGVTLHLPRSGDGRHADYVPCLGLAFVDPPGLPDEPEAPERDDMERFLDKMRERDNEGHWESVAKRVSGY
jgi:hypothetical protein